ncbi:methyltransferase [Streptomyces sp. WG7]|uniref:methyltransferase n=1 Tax=Streptomyces sp. WG7 TaxID=3417650 RepID=UPI003CE828A9
MSFETEFSEAVDGLAPVALRTAATLRLADHIAAGFDTVPRLADRIGADRDVLERLLRFLVARGVFGEPVPATYALTPLSALLLEGHPARLRAWLDERGVGARMDEAVRALSEGVRTGRCPYDRLHGGSFYADLAARSSGPSFDDLRQAHAEGFAGEIADAFPWDRVGHVVDVGGGTGVLLETLLRRFPCLHATLVDLPETVAAATRRITGAGLNGRFTPSPGSFFDTPPPRADVHTLVNVLHNLGDEQAVTLLRHCARAAAPDGTVIVGERLADEADTRAITSMDLRMFLLLGGKERSLAQLRAAAETAGLAYDRRTALPSGLQLIRFRTGDRGPA